VESNPALYTVPKKSKLITKPKAIIELKMEKNLNIQSENSNLLNNPEYRNVLQFESEYGAIVRGGHFPYYFGEEKSTRLVNDINILSSKEQKEIVNNLFTSKN
jgi:hypothetical protein